MKHRLVILLLALSPAIFVAGIAHSILTGSYAWAYAFVVAVIVGAVAFVVDLLKR